MEELKLIVHKQWSFKRIFILAFLVVTGAATVAGVLTFQNLRSKASTVLPSPTPFLASPPVSSPRGQLDSPYVRLVIPKNSYPFGANVPIDVYMTTGGAPTVEASIAIAFNPDYLEISKTNIEIEDVYKSYDIEMDQDGKVQIVLFVDTRVGLPPVTIDEEKKVAHLVFKTKSLQTDKADITIDYNKKDTQKTNLTEDKQEHSEKPVNLFDSVEGVTLKITP